MWQQLYDSLKDRNFMIVAVAQDSRADAARPWIEQAKPTYWSLIDSGIRAMRPDEIAPEVRYMEVLERMEK